jgi:hypothetical protein
VIRDNDVVVYNFAFRRLGGSRQATHEGSKNYDPFEQKLPLTERDWGRVSTFFFANSFLSILRWRLRLFFRFPFSTFQIVRSGVRTAINVMQQTKNA